MNLPADELLVATLIAGAGIGLHSGMVEDAVKKLESKGAQVALWSWLDEGEAADIFFSHGRFPHVDLPFDVIVQPVRTRRKKLLVADMESTIIAQEMLDELAKITGIGPEIEAITRAAMNGELDFAQALRARVQLLKGNPEKFLEIAAKRITPMPGAPALVSTMKELGASCWLVSGGFTYFAELVAGQLGFNRVFANVLGVENGAITGEVIGNILDKETKKIIFDMACTELGISPAEAIAVGDGANDVPMLQACQEGGGLAVAYYAKPRVRAAVMNQINYGNLTALLYAQGYKAKRDVGGVAVSG